MKRLPVKALQDHADKVFECLKKRGHEPKGRVKPKIASRGESCIFRGGGTHGHCHFDTGKICINRYWAEEKSLETLKKLIEHEVTHLFVYNHYPKFHKVLADATPRHRHKWKTGKFIGEELKDGYIIWKYEAVCRICGRKAR